MSYLMTIPFLLLQKLNLPVLNWTLLVCCLNLNYLLLRFLFLSPLLVIPSMRIVSHWISHWILKKIRLINKLIGILTQLVLITLVWATDPSLCHRFQYLQNMRRRKEATLTQWSLEQKLEYLNQRFLLHLWSLLRLLTHCSKNSGNNNDRRIFSSLEK